MKIRPPKPRAVDYGQTEIPRELFSRADPTWSDLARTERWYLRHVGAVPDPASGLGISAYPSRRSSAALHAWCSANGLEDPDEPGLPDLFRLGAMGWH